MSSAVVLQELLDCVYTATAGTIGGQVCQKIVMPAGELVMDYCGGECDDYCGTVFVTVRSASLYSSFGFADIAEQRCGKPLQLNVDVGILRCVPLNEDGTPMSPEDMTELAYILDSDMYAMREAVLCCFSGGSILTAYTPIPQDGGCIGGYWQTIIDMG